MKKNLPIVTAVCRAMITLLFILITGSVFAQARWQADVSIVSVAIVPAPALKKVSRVTDNINRPEQKVVQSTNDNLKCTIVVHNENDDDAWNTQLIVALPVEVTVVNMPSNATVDKTVTATQPFAGYVIFNLGHMTVQQNVTVEFTFTKSKFGNNIGAFAYSSSPDPNPANNYKDAVY